MSFAAQQCFLLWPSRSDRPALSRLSSILRRRRGDRDNPTTSRSTTRERSMWAESLGRQSAPTPI